jgi:hypothetical protein
MCPFVPELITRLLRICRAPGLSCDATRRGRVMVKCTITWAIHAALFSVKFEYPLMSVSCWMLSGLVSRHWGWISNSIQTPKCASHFVLMASRTRQFVASASISTFRQYKSCHDQIVHDYVCGLCCSFWKKNHLVFVWGAPLMGTNPILIYFTFPSFILGMDAVHNM